ncbi:phenylalanyl-tRNA synthetase, beta subunit [secondary endosymbiont of Heteropsylla cubana]|uniref:Phenylalanine--tRNA ligase beta subunit n=1 Tax=secondary endosymbiont of Heteropsylla cubana TaxID=134287 RepID=J3TYZ4_9ENTR|nr:phenylalanine--tRNA ligase subunit beta [secondary endosymbiont of Heteropsylla cubana]AFP85665.1 phenylalanyl-tRNA synthetase, beta subunit [secondary endosymbiont of Heteropsylla cubana]
MKVSERWLREWINPDINSEELVDQITMLGLEVESVEPVSGYFSNVVIGRIVGCQQHPTADKLRITKVDIGKKNLLNIVCGAKNCCLYLHVAVAIPGAILPGNVKIKSTIIRGELSEGMLCSFSELGINYNHHPNNVIIELPDAAPIGQDIHTYLQLNDKSININVTPNRADCLGLLGIARDVASYNHLPIQMPTIKMIPPEVIDTLPIQVDAIKACPQYLSRIIKNIDIHVKTPLWMQEKLRRCGIFIVDVITDIMNYVLLELGQPFHVFDLAHVEQRIVVRHAKDGETMKLLDGKELKLLPDTLVITDYSQVISIAGIFSGSAATISENTIDIILECAFFNPSAIIGYARHYGLHTYSSQRYERGVDPTLQPHAMERVTDLLISICGGQPGPVINITSLSTYPQLTNITLRRATLDRLIGHVISDEDVIKILKHLGCQVSYVSEGWQIIGPSWRFDLSIEEDLIEEIARIYGYEAIPIIKVNTEQLNSKNKCDNVLPMARVKTLLVDRDYQEAITYSFVDPKIQSLLHFQQKQLIVANPISQDMSAMRLSLWTGLIGALLYNQNRQQHRIRLFETGFCFIPDDAEDFGIRQDLMVGAVISGSRFNNHWDQPHQNLDFYDAKGDLEAILDLTCKVDDIDFKITKHSALHPGQSAEIYLNNESIGFIGVIHPELEKRLNLNNPTIVFELIWKKLTTYKLTMANKISRFPANRRDISLLVPDDVTAAAIIKECKKIIKNQLVNINIFDVYRGPGVQVGFKSVGVSLILQDITRTLKEKEISSIVTKCISILKQRFAASLRS